MGDMADHRSSLLITPPELGDLLDQVQVIDVRWRLGSPGTGRELHSTSRIPGSRFLDLESVLSTPRSGGGRHPLPDPEDFARSLCDHGIGKGDSVVVYDDMGGAVAARLWWMMRWIGADSPRVLDGGFDAWQEQARPLESGPPPPITPCKQPWIPRLDPEALIDGEDLLGRLDSWLLLDAREGPRYRGEFEPVDPQAGHIPGARSAFFGDNLDENKRFRGNEELRQHFESLGVTEESRVVCYCGSGVTACHNLLALELAGLPGARLYPGSWSEWCELPGASVET